MRDNLIEIVQPLLAWYRQSARELSWRSDPQPYRVWVSEIMLQQTRVEAVKPYYERFMSELPDVASLAGVEEEKLLKLWEGLGYYSRVRNLQKAARIVMERYDGELPASFEALRELPGIGEYTAGAIASIAFGLPVPAVDGNVLRVLSRVTESDDDITQAKVKRDFASRLKEIYPRQQPGDFTQALMELGAMVCVPNGAPLCGLCPLSHCCLAHQHGTEGKLPVKAAKKARRVEQKTVFLLRCGEKAALAKRADSGLLAGLWEFPNVEGHLSPEEAGRFLYKKGAALLEIKRLKKAKHIFTHVEWVMEGYSALLQEETPGLIWVSREEMAAGYPLPNAFKAFQTVLLKEWEK